MMENNYIVLLTLTGFSFQYEWLRKDSRRALFRGSCALGLNLLTRLTTGLDLIAAGIFVLLALWFEGAGFDGARDRRLWRRLVDYCKVPAPVFIFFLALHLAYQFYRFESFPHTYHATFPPQYPPLRPSPPPHLPRT